MTCCGTIGKAAVHTTQATEDTSDTGVVFSVPSIHCGNCISTIERALNALPGVHARVNLTLKRVSVTGGALDEIIATLDGLGHPATPIDPGDLSALTADDESTRLLKALAVAGFAAANIMLLSVSVWSGASGPTRDLFHLISALIAIPTVGYAGQVFFRSAISALRHGRLNMDVPISLAVLLALAMSVYETSQSGANAYFDAAVTLLFFLLIGRYLDRRMRDRALGAVAGLRHLTVKGATQLHPDGATSYTAIADIRPGMLLRIHPGDRIPVNAAIVDGTGDLDRSLVTGENTPVTVTAGDTIEAGALNINGALDIRALRTADTSFVAEIAQLLAAAEGSRGVYVGIADRMARLYAPAVHILAAAAFAGWFIATQDWQVSIYVAIAVLIVTCPCALGLAVPVVRVVAATRLFREGILLKNGTALERLAEADTVVFDKTGTLTTGHPTAAANTAVHRAAAPHAAVARALAIRSTHPASQAVATLLSHHREAPLRDIVEVPGSGIEGWTNGRRARLGKPAWVAGAEHLAPTSSATVAFAIDGEPPTTFAIAEDIRPEAAAAIARAKQAGLTPHILSGDNSAAVQTIATRLGIAQIHAGRSPAAKVAHIEQLHAAGHRTLMVGDGINDAPSLAAGHVSMAPASASDIGRQAADMVYTRNSLTAVPFARTIAIRANRVIRQNFALAIAYNCIAVPLAVAGQVTPLTAAIAMSASSIAVVANSLRLARTQSPAQQSIPPIQSLRLARP